MTKPIPDLINNLPNDMVFNESTRMIEAHVRDFRIDETFQYFCRWLETYMPYSYDADHYMTKENINNEKPEWFRENISCWSYFYVYVEEVKMRRLHFVDEKEMLLFRLRLG